MGSTGDDIHTLPPPAKDQVYVKVAALHGGFLTLPEKLFVSNPEPDKAATVPSLCFLIEHPSTGKHRPHRIVFDLGLKRNANDYVEGMRHHIQNRQPIIHLPDARASLRAGGLGAATDIDTVVLSHIHWDHVGTPSDYSRAMFVVGSGTFHALEHGVPHYPSEMMEVDLLPEGRSLELPPVPSSQHKAFAAPKEQQNPQTWDRLADTVDAIDFFGDGSMYIVDSPGHILGHLNALLRVSPDKWIFLGGDCAHDRRLITGEMDIAVYSDGCGGVRSVHSDLPTARQTLSSIRKLLALNEDSVEWVVAHDGNWAAENAHRFYPGYM
ncbi:hypothetical protein M409DRAFT_71523 [Zasmidium cellare ATCC 36951]|uniref:Metallo-beta-lactamase domain-containing protein n=1 Tax=Zasmidium cellare ATCC 36951 TaxID=1080233 RepID=A0A6A6BXL3_ZASCE|nr:uncharacterized protein M409DRAFT_71523 [Zasmidium cellare ATCC 36951]KAF2158670.1 hypothetical protein M409DRAFT_71523 [Zasmidium cellare ATCC 36951]